MYGTIMDQVICAATQTMQESMNSLEGGMMETSVLLAGRLGYQAKGQSLLKKKIIAPSGNKHPYLECPLLKQEGFVLLNYFR